MAGWTSAEANQRCARLAGGGHFALNTGYLKQRILRRLRRFTLDAEQQESVRRLILSTIPRGRRLEFTELRRLARKVDSPDFKEALRQLAESDDTDTSERAMVVLGPCLRPQP